MNEIPNSYRIPSRLGSAFYSKLNDINSAIKFKEIALKRAPISEKSRILDDINFFKEQK